MIKTIEGQRFGLPPDDEAVDNVRGGQRLTRIIQFALAIYLLPALALVLLIGFTMLLIGAIIQGVLRAVRALVPPRRYGPRSEPSVSGAWIYRVGGGAFPISGGVSRGLELQQLHIGTNHCIVDLRREEVEVEPRPDPVGEHADICGRQGSVRILRFGRVEDC